MSNRSIVAVIVLAVVAFLLTQTFYTVDPTKQVLVRQFGAIVGDPKTEPAASAKIPIERSPKLNSIIFPAIHLITIQNHFKYFIHARPLRQIEAGLPADEAGYQLKP